MIERQVLWNNYEVLGKYHWASLIIDKSEEIDKFNQSVEYIFRLKPGSRKIIYSGTINSLDYELSSWESSLSKLDFSRFYQGRIRRDRRLGINNTANGWVNALGRLHRGEI